MIHSNRAKKERSAHITLRKQPHSSTGAHESACLRHKTPLSYTFCGIPFCKECRREDRPEIDGLISAGKSEAKRAHDLLTLKGMKKGSANV